VQELFVCLHPVQIQIVREQCAREHAGRRTCIAAVAYRDRTRGGQGAMSVMGISRQLGGLALRWTS
jgi:hypothetical protein